MQKEIINPISTPLLDLSISIVNYNTTDYVIQLIKSLKETISTLTYEILIFDNNSEDKPERIVEEHKEVLLKLNDHNVFYTKADNYNVNRSRGKFIAAINPDIIVFEGALDKMVEFLEQHTDVGAVTPRFVFADGTLQPSITPFLTYTYSLFGALGINYFFPHNKVRKSVFPEGIYYNPDIPQEAEVLYGALIMFRREVLQTVGTKDDKFVHGWDEYDWCLRIKQAGWKLYYLPTAVVQHYRSVTAKVIESDVKKAKQVERLGKNGYLYFYRKHYGFLPYVVLVILWKFRGLIVKLFSAK